MNNYLVNGSVILMGNQGGASAEVASADGSTAKTGKEGVLGNPMILMLGGLFIIMYFFMIRPQSKKQKEVRNMLAQLEKGDKILSAGGIKGVVDDVKEDTVIVKVADNTKLEFSKASITHVLEKKNPVEPPAKGFSLFKKKNKDKVEDKKDSSKKEEKKDSKNSKEDKKTKKESSEKKANTPDL